MQVVDQPQRHVNDDGQPIEHIEPTNSRWSEIDILRDDDTVRVRAEEAATGEVYEESFDVNEQMYQGLSRHDGRPSTLDSDLECALNLVGFCPTDTITQGY